MTPKKIPTRRCTACGTHMPKPQLLRVLRTPTGEIIVDLSGKISGRGAYLCKSMDCLKKARKSGRLSTSLECPIPDDVYVRIEEELTRERD